MLAPKNYRACGSQRGGRGSRRWDWQGRWDGRRASDVEKQDNRERKEAASHLTRGGQFHNGDIVPKRHRRPTNAEMRNGERNELLLRHRRNHVEIYLTRLLGAPRHLSALRWNDQCSLLAEARRGCFSAFSHGLRQQPSWHSTKLCKTSLFIPRHFSRALVLELAWSLCSSPLDA